MKADVTSDPVHLSSVSSPAGDTLLENLVEECTNRLRSGQTIDVADLALRHPEHAGRILQLIPSLELMAAMGRSHDDPNSGDLSWTDRSALSFDLPFELGDYRLIRVT
jgi:hypothetical protein